MACITLLTDFGTRDASVAIVKGVLYQHVDRPKIIDLSHQITPFSIDEAAYTLASTYHNFPVGTVHIALVDVFYDLKPNLVLCQYNGHFIIAPDNGLIPKTIRTLPHDTWLCYAITQTDNFSSWLHQIGKTVNQLQQTKPQDIDLPKWELQNQPILKKVRIIGDTVICEVIYIDQYENVVLNITKQEFDSYNTGREFTIKFKQVEEIIKISTNYKQVREHDKLCRFNSNGYLEICINNGKAASLFGLRLGSPNNHIKIIFQ